MILPVFETERLILKEVTLEHADAYQKHFNDYEVISQLASHVPWPYPDDGAYQFIKNVILPRQGNNFWIWGIFLKSNPSELIGGVHMYRSKAVDNRGFWLGRQFWGQGIMTEAVAPITDYAFNQLGFDKIILANAVGNLKSRRVKEKAGAKWLRAEPMKFVNPEYKEHELWELTKEDWFRNR